MDKYIKEDLTDLDFSAGIRAEYINNNFNLIKDWITRERKRIGGWGLVEGFDMSANPNEMTVTVAEGIMVNTDGEELKIPETTFSVKDLEPIKYSETVLVPEDGIIYLQQRPYSVSERGYFHFARNTSSKQYPLEDEFSIKDVSSDASIYVAQIDHKMVYVNKEYAGHKLEINYYTNSNRIDSVLLMKDGSYKYEVNIASSSPSHVDLGDYDNFYMIGAIYWNIDDCITASFYTDHRTYRKVYVDEQNRLWLNGELYKAAKFIYFEEPEEPKTNDIWYDGDSNTLMTWKEKDGTYGWVVMNDTSSIEVRETKIFYPGTADYPEDLQSFRFKDDEVNLWFVPGQRCLEIIIDNVPVMSDQYTEFIDNKVTDKKYTALGRGFDLKDPLDRATPVEVVIKHAVRAKPVKETFQRAAIFIDENYDHYSTINTSKVIEAPSTYAVGDQQLEVYLDGKRLTRNLDFVEMVDDQTDASASDKGKLSRFYRLTCDVKDGQQINTKISKYVWSFDQLDSMIHDIETVANEAHANAKKNTENMTRFSANVQERFEAVDEHFEKTEEKLDTLKQYQKKTDKVPYSNLPDEIKSKVFSGKISQVFDATGVIQLEAKETDVIFVNYMSEEMNRILMEGTEYTVVSSENKLTIMLEPYLMSEGAQVYVTGFKVGV